MRIGGARQPGLAPAPEPLAVRRRRRLIAAGFPEPLARRLAADCAFDLQALIELAARGCPPELAARIAAPLREERRPC